MHNSPQNRSGLSIAASQLKQSARAPQPSCQPCSLRVSSFGHATLVEDGTGPA